jgi:hypothetical protein
LNVIGLIKIAVTVPLLFIAVGYGITAVAMAQAAAAIMLSVIRLVIAAKVLDIELGSLVRQYRSPFLAGAVLVTATWPMLAVVGDWPAGWQLLVLVPVGLVAYIGSLLLIDRPLVSATMAFVQSSRAK